MSRLKVFLEERKSCTGDEAQNIAISKIYYSAWSQDSEAPELLEELLQKAAPSALSYLQIHGRFSPKGTTNSPVYASKVFDVVCTMKRLAHLTIASATTTVAHLRR